MIQIFKDGKHVATELQWHSPDVPNDSWIYDAKGTWWHKLLNRTIEMMPEQVPAIYRAWILITH